MNKHLTKRIALHNNVSKSLAKLSDQELFSLLQSTENTYSGIGGKAAILELGGIKIFTKKIPRSSNSVPVRVRPQAPNEIKPYISLIN